MVAGCCRAKLVCWTWLFDTKDAGGEAKRHSTTIRSSFRPLACTAAPRSCACRRHELYEEQVRRPQLDVRQTHNTQGGRKFALIPTESVAAPRRRAPCECQQAATRPQLCPQHARDARLDAGPTVVIPDISTIPLGIETVGSAASGGPWIKGPCYQTVVVGHVRALKLDATVCGRSV